MEHSILFGNGFNYFSENFEDISWDGILQSLNKDGKSKNESTFQNSMPYTFQYECTYLTYRKNGRRELEIKNKVKEQVQKLEPNIMYESLSKLKTSNFLTTNYDHAFEKTLYKSPSSEEHNQIRYSTKRHKVFNLDDDREIRLWYIHGDIDYPSSIMLGFDQYAGTLSMIKSRITSSLSSDGIYNAPPKVSYWVDLFFTSHIHIIGLSLDYSEIDIWWALDKRQRLIEMGKLKTKNEIHYYGSPNPSKKFTLESFGVHVHEFEEANNENNRVVYKNMLDEINNKIRDIENN